jgi:hypothetical protein
MIQGVPTKFSGFHIEEGKQPADLQPYIGQKVKGAWVFDRREFYVWMESNDLLLFEPVKSIGDVAGVILVVCHSKPGADFADVVAATRTPHTNALKGMTLDGMCGDAVVFNKEFGVMITPDGVKWVKLV